MAPTSRDEKSNLILNKLEKDRIIADVKEIVGGNTYSITLGNGNVTVTVPYQLESGKDADKLMIYYITDGRVAEEIPCLYNDGYVTFVTDHLSTYAIMYIGPAEQDFPIMYVAIGGIAILALAGGTVSHQRAQVISGIIIR